MFTKIMCSILTFLMPIVIYFGNRDIAPSFINPEALKTEIEYVYDNSDKGSAAGEITVTSKKDGDYDVYWADENGDKISTTVDGYTVNMSEFLSVEVDDGEGTATVQEFTYIPEEAETVTVYFKNVKCAQIDIPENKKSQESELLYSFGVLSDVHFDRYHYAFADVATLTFPNALNFLQKLAVSMVAMPGDLSSSGEEEAFQKFNNITSNYNFPIYTTTGNHDVSDEFTLKNWNKYINSGVYSETKANGVLTVSDNNLDFVYQIPGTEEVFVFLNQIAWSYGNPDQSRILDDAQLDWLDAQLKQYQNKTVYLFFHTFASVFDENGQPGCGNLVSPNGATYDLPFTAGAPDEVRFKSILNANSNVIYFSGHSHWEFAMQKYNSKLNIADYGLGGATSVHVSSVSSPRFATDKSKGYDSTTMEKSEGYYVEVYSDKIVLNGIDFLKGQFLAYATYEIDR